ncbi:hypothetical protein JL09_g6353 [Pichia kudriavzevii]|uniref:Uncharacterized protein n=1 Tax=Pichia kudriavzevii TaxID=4909 RepID=A0A099NPQ1_PICKU|nr:hypothetical protein JL09_g6353 [Pichia kudriavzevii]
MITIKSGFIVLSEYRNNRVLLSDVNIVTTIVLLFDVNISMLEGLTFEHQHLP